MPRSNFSPYPVDPRGFVKNTAHPCEAYTWNSWYQSNPNCPAGPPWIVRIIGYFFPDSQPIGFMKNPSTSQPSAPLNATRSTGDSFNCARSALLTWVSAFSPRPFRSATYRSSRCVGSLIAYASLPVLSLTSAKCTVRSPDVIAVALRAARSTRKSWLVPLNPVSKYRALPAFAHRSAPGIRSTLAAASREAVPPVLDASQIFGCDFSGTE